MGAQSSSISELTDNEYLRRLASAEPVSHNDPFWNQLLSFSFATPTNSSDSRLLEEATESICKSLINNNPRTGNFAALVNVFISRTKELKISAECQNELFIWQAHNALFIVRCLIKALQSHTSEEELTMHFTYSPVTPGSCLESESEGGSLLEDMVLHLIHLIIEVPLLDITYCIHLEAVTTLMVLLAAQLHQRHVVRDGPLYYLFTQGRSCELASRLVKALMYHFIRQERCPPHISSPSAHARGSGLLSGLASGLWTVLTLGGAASGGKLAAPQQHAEGSSPLANQSLLLLLALMNLSETEEQANPYRRALLSFHNTQDKAPQEQPTFQINFNSLYTALCERQGTDEATLFLYLLLHQNTNVRTYVLARTDTETLVLPILQTLYHAEQKNSHHVYMSLIVLLIMSEDDAFNCSVHEVMLRNVPWYTERALSEISLGSLLILVVIRTIQYNMTRTRDKYLHTNCLAALANMSAQFHSLHQYAAQRIMSLLELLSRKHNKVLEQATQMHGASLGEDGSPSLPDYAQDLTVIEEVIRMMLEVVNSCLCSSLQHNPNLVYTLLYKRELFEQYRAQPAFADVMQNIDTVISFFGARLEQAGTGLSVDQVVDVIKQGAILLPKDRLKKFPELKFKYVEEESPEEFFVPYVWSLIYNTAVGLHWSPRQIQLFPVDCV
ncbi:dymeclin [Lethenteron reissneri]|uniref:dymeclin n=1 Tax=Lethenteron reissneri TaxID=7753 RepID=UPI002AB6FFBD|nr:dymeclin [Lethenteron reissneri]XP_061414369.1 dymeclin [Lethenteron reissneri]